MKVERGRQEKKDNVLLCPMILLTIKKTINILSRQFESFVDGSALHDVVSEPVLFLRRHPRDALSRQPCHRRRAHYKAKGLSKYFPGFKLITLSVYLSVYIYTGPSFTCSCVCIYSGGSFLSLFFCPLSSLQFYKANPFAGALCGLDFAPFISS